eukprot:TRINITY_DN31557_c0_g1_i1.p1 TRINITY_DN31557_c0_g1~~TRINITY_DN31557_c0_g1_i1.p1  ORF type:complete len:106 (-),score=7.32 TRINITY_DN31557_c0_g1_i1:214-531(-)
MFVLLRGDPCLPQCQVVGLDILATRHPKLFSLIVDRMGFELGQNNVVLCAGELNFRCQPDAAGRQIILKPNFYPTDVLNILTETGGFIFKSSTSAGEELVWILEK